MSLLRDVFNTIKNEQILDPVNASATQTSAEVDLAGCEGVMLSVNFGESGDTLSGALKWDCKLTECDSSGGLFTDVAADDVIGNTTNQFGLVDAAADDDAVYSLGYKGNLRYVKAVATMTGVHTNGTPISMSAIKNVASQPPGNAVNP